MSTISGFKKRKDYMPFANTEPLFEDVATLETNTETEPQENESLIEDNPMDVTDFNDKMMSGLTVSVSIDFTEAVAETDVLQDHLAILKQFFVAETPMKKEDVLSKISKCGDSLRSQPIIHTYFVSVPTINSTLIQFISKNTFFKTLMYGDQSLMYRENFNLLIHFCLVKYHMASSGFDQLSWLLMTNVSNIGTRILSNRSVSKILMFF